MKKQQERIPETLKDTVACKSLRALAPPHRSAGAHLQDYQVYLDIWIFWKGISFMMLV